MTTAPGQSRAPGAGRWLGDSHSSQPAARHGTCSWAVSWAAAWALSPTEGRGCLKRTYLEQPVLGRGPGDPGTGLLVSHPATLRCTGPWKVRSIRSVLVVAGQTGKELRFSSRCTPRLPPPLPAPHRAQPGTQGELPAGLSRPHGKSHGSLSLDKAAATACSPMRKSRGSEEGGGTNASDTTVQTGACWAEGPAGAGGSRSLGLRGRKCSDQGAAGPRSGSISSRPHRSIAHSERGQRMEMRSHCRPTVRLPGLQVHPDFSGSVQYFGQCRAEGETPC